ncbi:phosphate ABC transporter permease subunit PstC [Methanolobus zinderi]|uniref:Phosphate transport system permease protein n=1 Tax=Methanolobus zinderi TaxID=536044 RepID=A0A7D5EE29_9EURY|nr:phosphate ABC transporter permease subunit PstC [Methanolobus zinderi]QLC49774.1 phosphate ABC transporter permease subunit PstC [Methanolobus zinderi]
MNNKRLDDRYPQYFFFMCAFITVSVAVYFILFIFNTAMPTFQSQGIINFLTGTVWSYDDNIYGIRTFIAGTIVITIVSLIIAVPISVFTAIFLSEYASSNVASTIRPFIELLVGIPSVVYGIFGLFVLENFFQNNIDPLISALSFIPIFEDLTPNRGNGVLLASTVLAIMILPTITSLSENAMRSVPFDYREASFAIGATHWETIKKIVLPTASPGILTAIILGMMRAMGETMAIVMLLGNVGHVPGSILDTGYAMTSKILNDIGYYSAMDGPRSALFAIAAVLFAIEIFFVAAARRIGGSR